MISGTVVSYKGFKFYDGEESDKLLILLNDGNKKPYLVLRTTSQPKRPKDEGCHSSLGFYFIPVGRSFFLKNTWVLLYEPYEINAVQFLKAKFEGKASIVNSLPEQLTRAIINCFKKSEDCSDYHLSLLH